jgi:hypothetical protein
MEGGDTFDGILFVPPPRKNDAAEERLKKKKKGMNLAPKAPGNFCAL